MAKAIIGTVVSNKADKTINISIVTRKTHPLYKKQYSETRKFMAHDPKNEAEVGDLVSIVPCRPISAKKRFILDKIIAKPALRDEHLEATKVEDEASRPKSKSKAEKEEEDDSAAN